MFDGPLDLRGLEHLVGDQKLFLASVNGGLPEPLPMPESGVGDLSPDGERVVYSPLFRDFRTWKRYEGGWAQDLWIFDVDRHDVTPVAQSKRTERDPMWVGDAIYFNSDRSGTYNLYRYDVGSSEVTQLTDSGTWDVRWPSDDGRGRIVYELDGVTPVYRAWVALYVDGVNYRVLRSDVDGNFDFGLVPTGVAEIEAFDGETGRTGANVFFEIAADQVTDGSQLGGLIQF